MKAFPLLAILCGSLLLFSCNKGGEDQPHHNTTYVWGEDDWSQIWPADRVAASADSTLVDYVILHNNGVSFHGKTTTVLLQQLNTIIEDVAPSNRYKVQGSGTLNDIGIGREQNVEDSIQLAKMGFGFGHIRYIGGFR